MKNLLLYSVIAATVAIGATTAEAKPKHKYHHRHDDRRDRHDRHYGHHHHHSHRTRTIYVIENRRPVRRVVYVHPSGYYYRVVGGRPLRIRERYYTSYPSRYYYSDGRPRIGVSFSF